MARVVFVVSTITVFGVRGPVISMVEAPLLAGRF